MLREMVNQAFWSFFCLQREFSLLFHSSDPRADINDAGQVVLALQWEHETSGLEKQEGDACQSLIKNDRR